MFFRHGVFVSPLDAAGRGRDLLEEGYGTRSLFPRREMNCTKGEKNEGKEGEGPPHWKRRGRLSFSTHQTFPRRHFRTRSPRMVSADQFEAGMNGSSLSADLILHFNLKLIQIRPQALNRQTLQENDSLPGIELN